MKQETLDFLRKRLSSGQHYTAEEINKIATMMEGTDNDYYGMLEEDGIIKTVANLDEDEPRYFVELVEK